jgi:MFS family permease
MSYGAVVSFIALYAEERQVQNIGLFFTVYAIALLVSRPYFGRLADQKGNSFAVIPGIAAILGAMVILYFAHSLSIFLFAGFIYGLGFGAVQPSLQAMAVRNVEPSRRGAANATFFLGFDLGIGIGSILWGMVAQVAGYGLIYIWAMVPVMIALFVYFKISSLEQRSI